MARVVIAGEDAAVRMRHEQAKANDMRAWGQGWNAFEDGWKRSATVAWFGSAGGAGWDACRREHIRWRKAQGHNVADVRQWLRACGFLT